MTVQDINAIAARAGRNAIEAGARHEAVAQAVAVLKGNAPGLFLAEGLWLSAQAMKYGAQILALYICPEYIYTDEWTNTAASLIGYSDETYIISPKVYERLGEDKGDRGMLALIRLPRWQLNDIPPGERSTVLVLDGLENPGNVGTLIRTAEGAGAEAVILCNKRTGLNNRMVVRSSLCTVLNLPVLEADAGETMDFLQRRGYSIYLGKAESAVRYCDTGYAMKTAIVVGHEKYGVSLGWFERPHIGVAIPMLGQVDSLNVAVAGGILLYEVGRSHGFQ